MVTEQALDIHRPKAITAKNWSYLRWNESRPGGWPNALAQSATVLSTPQSSSGHAAVSRSLPGGCGATDADSRDCRWGITADVRTSQNFGLFDVERETVL